MIEALPRRGAGLEHEPSARSRAAFAELVSLAGELGLAALFLLMKINIYFA